MEKRRKWTTVDSKRSQQSCETDHEIDQVLVQINKKEKKLRKSKVEGIKNKVKRKSSLFKKESSIKENKEGYSLCPGQSFSLMRVRVFLILRCKLATCRTYSPAPSAIPCAVPLFMFICLNQLAPLFFFLAPLAGINNSWAKYWASARTFN